MSSHPVSSFIQWTLYDGAENTKIKKSSESWSEPSRNKPNRPLLATDGCVLCWTAEPRLFAKWATQTRVDSLEPLGKHDEILNKHLWQLMSTMSLMTLRLTPWIYVVPTYCIREEPIILIMIYDDDAAWQRSKGQYCDNVKQDDIRQFAQTAVTWVDVGEHCERPWCDVAQCSVQQKHDWAAVFWTFINQLHTLFSASLKQWDNPQRGRRPEGTASVCPAWLRPLKVCCGIALRQVEVDQRQKDWKHISSHSLPFCFSPSGQKWIGKESITPPPPLFLRKDNEIEATGSSWITISSEAQAEARGLKETSQPRPSPSKTEMLRWIRV